MDKMYIKDLELFGYHGVFEEEKRLGQKFIISLELDLDLKFAARTGDLTKSVHYGELCEKVENEFLKESYDLIETAALNLADFILNEYKIINGVKVFLKKPWAPVKKHLDTVEIMIERKRHKAYIGLGSNIGNKEKNLNDAIHKISEQKNIIITKKSTFIVTEPWGYLDQEEFVNGVVEIETTLEPEELMDLLLKIELELKRERLIKWGPRTIDLDILMYDDLISNDEKIILPHPRMHEREFVLKPLNEIAPYLLHPILNKRVFTLLEEIQK
ncbi:2-amino-4-hydroxy-6-hydroxymethyldihydropteridine diphosphokinase [Clostridium saccharobutylicum]|uniref:Bifunctional folate synthesis protein n=1 Tax=Clostridium saccharobutylicum DSM 13864 TaxID=1345695 RepID=U5MLA5_CLOSA|nr:2-amino-4-hydroxy-6-hydroxymethyldihydropteridine diphosphokinase [Clostridium saccharobutylicum]AGX41313.1 sulD: bifunctional folate synthesis protein [Clostridium saccharobutylicum DSM 13864]AQR88599.1 bifunctional folate synthesis protein [Clostridium saccharobutylicum]AQR98497.1 bifunctional folate synthesis protein [Clostridium saccharobutylicum]AQS08209.1 bifunctional folate synthesis protein [Clostridium saccharobutylicum]AQS12487.1 bifunctional folate synthesis protein [Clostridium 